MSWSLPPWLQAFRKLPRNAAAIHTEWPIKEGGICVYAWTDQTGEPFLAVKTLNRIGKTSGFPDWQRRRQFRSDIVVGFIERRPLVMRIGVKVTFEGLELIVRLPSEIKGGKDFIEKRFAAWNSGKPTFSFTLVPTFEPYASPSFPTT
jgi:hypothetical protein